MERYRLEQPLESGIQEVALRVKFGAGTVYLDGKAPDGLLVKGDLEYEINPPRHRYNLRNGQAEFDVQPEDHILHRGRSHGLDWDLNLSPVPVYELVKLDLGACKCRIDLSALDVREFELHTGAAEIELSLGDRARDARGSIGVGAASVRVRIPRTVGAKIELSGAMSSTNLGSGSGLLAGHRAWTSRGYEEKGSHLDLRVSAGFSKFDVDWVE